MKRILLLPLLALLALLAITSWTYADVENLKPTPTTTQERFVAAVFSNDIPAIKTALNQGADINALDEASQQHILHQYILSDSLLFETIQFLVENGADIYATDAAGHEMTPMIALALSANSSPDREKVLCYFIEKGVPFKAAFQNINNKQEQLVRKQAELQQVLNANESEQTPYLYQESISLLEEAEREENG